MKKLLLSIMLLLVMISGGSQIGTDGLVCIPHPVLKQIRLELTELDFIKDTLIIHAHQDSLIQAQIYELNGLIGTKDVIITYKDSLISVKEIEIAQTQELLKVEKKKNRKHIIIHIGSGIMFLLLLAVAI